MVQIYLRLHNASTSFKKQCLSISLLLFAILHTGTHANAQCPTVSVTPSTSCGGVVNGGPCNALTASGNADTYVWSPLAGLYTNCSMTTPYTGTNTTVVYAARTSYTIYTVTGTITASGCSRTATAGVNYTPPAPIVTPNPATMCLGEPAIALTAGNSNTVQYCSGLVNIPVPDNNPAGASSNIFVSGIQPGCTITGMRVIMSMPHTRVGNMVFVLRSPTGTIINLDYHLSATGGSGTTSGFVSTVFSSTGITDLSAGTDPYTATFKADLQVLPAGGFGLPGPSGMQPNVSNWSPLFVSPNGNWTLGFYDGVTADTGTLTFWCLSFTYSCGTGIPARPAVWSPIAGLFHDVASTIPYTGIPTDKVWARPFPVGTYTYAAVTQSLPGPLASFTNPASISIPIGGTATAYSSDIIVSGLPATNASVSSVVLGGINHTRSNDIDIILQSPTGQNVMIMSDVGGTNAINATYTFDDWSPSMSSATANATGSYRPSNVGIPDNFPAPGPGNISAFTTLSTFTGNLNGTWKLFVIDDDGTAGLGMISGGYTINFDTVAPCFSPPRFVPVIVGLSVSITAQPVNKTVCADGVATFSVTATGGGPLTYQWQVSPNGQWVNITNGGFYSGATLPTLTVTTPIVSMSGSYYRVIINGPGTCGTAFSAAAILTVNPLPNIVINANPLIIGPTQTTTIFSTVTPNPAATYTWYYNNSVLPGAVSSSLLVSYGSAGDYQLKVTDVNGCTNLSNIISIANSFALNIYTYPNPNAGIFQVRYFSEPNNTLQRSLTVYNNMGNRIMTRNFTQTIPYQKIDVDVRAHGKGIYWIELKDANGKRLAINRAVVQ